MKIYTFSYLTNLAVNPTQSFLWKYFSVFLSEFVQISLLTTGVVYNKKQKIQNTKMTWITHNTTESG